MRGLLFTIALLFAVSVVVNKCQDRETQQVREKMTPEERQAWQDYSDRVNAELALCEGNMDCREFVAKESLRPFKEAVMDAVRKKHRKEAAP